jgi:transposase
MKGTSPSRASRIAASGIEVQRWEVRTLITHSKGEVHGHCRLSILPKNVFAVHGVNELGKPELVRPSVPRAKLPELVATLPPCVIGMEACTGAHHWTRLFARHGHTTPRRQ